MENIEYKGYNIEIDFDHDPRNPREDCENFGKMVCFHKRYNLGDEHTFKYADELLNQLWADHATDAEKRKYILDACKGNVSAYREVIKGSDDLQARFEYVVEFFRGIEEVPNAVLALPLFLYDHSGITINTTGFSCQWDSGQIGLVYVTDAQIIKEYGSVTPENVEKAKELILAEVKAYDAYLTGQVYEYAITEACKCQMCGHTEKEVIDSCCGFYDEKDCLQQAKDSIDWIAKKAEQQLSCL